MHAKQILFFSLIPRRDARCSHILPPSPFFILVCAYSVDGVWQDWICVFILVFNVFVLVHAVPLRIHSPLCVVVQCLSPAPHLNVKPPPGGSHLSLGCMNTLSKHQSSETRWRTQTSSHTCNLQLLLLPNLLLKTPNLCMKELRSVCCEHMDTQRRDLHLDSELRVCECLSFITVTQPSHSQRELC